MASEVNRLPGSETGRTRGHNRESEVIHGYTSRQTITEYRRRLGLAAHDCLNLVQDGNVVAILVEIVSLSTPVRPAEAVASSYLEGYQQNPAAEYPTKCGEGMGWRLPRHGGRRQTGSRAG